MKKFLTILIIKDIKEILKIILNLINTTYSERKLRFLTQKKEVFIFYIVQSTKSIFSPIPSESKTIKQKNLICHLHKIPHSYIPPNTLIIPI